MRLYLFILISVLCCCCRSHQKEPAAIIIEGNITGLHNTKLYLADARKWKVPLDSAACKNGRFIFRITADPAFVPYPAAIYFLYNEDAGKPFRLQFRNHTLDDSLSFLRDAFYIEKGTTHISGRFGARPYLRLVAGKETELLFKNQFTDIGWMGDTDTALRNHKLLFLKTTVRENPFSYFLLQSIYDSKVWYSEKELGVLLRLFDSSVVNSPAGKKFSDYLRLRPDAGAAYPNLRLLAADNTLQQLIDTTAKLNMLVFWASWCTPCIKEIPQLKELYQQFSKKGLHMVNVSIDSNEEDWRHALPVHNMPWQQLLIAKDKIETVGNIFSFTTIPFIVFTDKDGKEVGRFADYDPDNTRKYEALIKKFIP